MEKGQKDMSEIRRKVGRTFGRKALLQGGVEIRGGTGPQEILREFGKTA